MVKLAERCEIAKIERMAHILGECSAPAKALQRMGDGDAIYLVADQDTLLVGPDLGEHIINIDGEDSWEACPTLDPREAQP